MGKPATLTPMEEERKARERQRNLDKAHREKAKLDAQQARVTRAEVIREERKRRPGCRCEITVRSTPAQLKALGEGCTGSRWGGPGYVCPCLDAIRRRLKL